MIAKHWKPCVAILVYLCLQFAGRVTAVIADVIICVFLYWLITKSFKANPDDKE